MMIYEACERLNIAICASADHMQIARDEIFGPVQSILKWDTLEEVQTPLPPFPTPRAPIDGSIFSTNASICKLIVHRPKPSGSITFILCLNC